MWERNNLPGYVGMPEKGKRFVSSIIWIQASVSWFSNSKIFSFIESCKYIFFKFWHTVYFPFNWTSYIHAKKHFIFTKIILIKVRKSHTQVTLISYHPKNEDTHENNSICFWDFLTLHEYKIVSSNIYWLMPCPSMGTKWFWTVQIICFGLVQIILDSSKL